MSAERGDHHCADGDMLELTAWPFPERHMAGGLLLAMVKAERAGGLSLRFHAKGMEDAELAMTVL